MSSLIFETEILPALPLEKQGRVQIKQVQLRLEEQRKWAEIQWKQDAHGGQLQLPADIGGDDTSHEKNAQLPHPPLAQPEDQEARVLDWPPNLVHKMLQPDANPKEILGYLFHEEYSHLTLVPMPSLVRPQMKSPPNDTSINIPKIIYQTSATNKIDKMFAVHAWEMMLANPDYEYRFYDDTRARAYIAEHLGPRVTETYDLIVPGGFKADLFRYCVMYCEGGWYLDINKKMAMPLNAILRHDNSDRQQQRPFELLLVGDLQRGNIYQALLASVPNLSIFQDCIQQIGKHARQNYYGPTGLHPTGPAMIGRIILQHKYGFCEDEPGIYYVGNKIKCLFARYNGAYIYDDLNRTLVQVSKSKSAAVHPADMMSNGKKHYGIMYAEKKVYASQPGQGRTVARWCEGLAAVAGIFTLVIFIAFLWPRPSAHK